MNHRDWCLEAFDKWRKDLPSYGNMLLDVGCRDECMREALEFRGFTWEGVDPLPQAFSVKKGTMEALPYEDNSFDIVFVCHAFEHCEHPIEALKEFQRVLKPNGWLFMATPMPCEHHILNADSDHIMVLFPIQFARLLLYTQWSDVKSTVHPGYPLMPDDLPEQNHTIITTGRKP